MTDKEAIEILENLVVPTMEQGQALSMALNALEQQSCEDCINREQAIRMTIKEIIDMAIKGLEQSDVLNKIRAEIKALSNANPSYWHSGDMVDREDVLEIIDKYKSESEDDNIYEQR